MNPVSLSPANMQESRPHYPALDGLRGLAILTVVIYHNFGFIDLFTFGWLSVDLFFVLSGFLITDILLRSIGEKNFLRKFFARRMLRIFPLYYLSLILFFLVLPRLVPHFQVDYYQDNQVWLWTYLQNWLYIFKNPNPNNALNHLWSLAVEEQFYLLWPLVILVLRKPKLLLVFICILLVAVLGLRVWVWKTQIANFAYYNLYTFTRIDGICIGCIVAILLKIKPGFLKKYTAAIVSFFALLNIAFFFVNRNYDFGFPYLALAGYTTFAMIFGLLVNEAVTRETKLINLALGLPILRFLGRISYGLYLFHWPLYILISPWLQETLALYVPPSSLQFTVSLVATLAAVLLSWLSFYLYEKPFLKLKSRFE